MRLKAGVLLLFFFTLSLPARTVFSETYRWTDDEGVMHFTDRRPPVRVETSVIPRPRMAGKIEKKSADEKRLYDFREKVVNIVGLDKILLESGKIVKYIGVRDPEEFLEKNGLERKIAQALIYHGDLVVGKTVTVLLGTKVKNKEKQYLGHVFLGQDLFINAELIRNGYGITEEYPSDFEYQSLFLRLEREAQEKGIGLWNF